VATGPHAAEAAALLEIRDLEIAFPSTGTGTGGWTPVVRGISLTVRRGEIVGLVGESGSGKSMTALAKTDLLTLPPRELRRVRGGRIALVFQEPATAFNPSYTIGFQIAEAVRAHRRDSLGRGISRKEALDEAARLLNRVALGDARRRLGDYPHQLSGGQRQRAMIAMALAGGPDLLLADEPTTALDVTLQAQILELMEEIRRDLGLAVLLITHDMGVVAETCDRVVVMRDGRVLEEAGVMELFRSPAHPYTRELLAAVPRLDGLDLNGEAS
jgi:peptide/nickel transport system ATP-binding protein